MEKEENYPIIIYEEIDNFTKTYKVDNKKSFEIKIDTLYENLKFKAKEFLKRETENKKVEITGKELICYSLSEIDCNPNDFNSKNIAVKLKSKFESNPEKSKKLKFLWDFLFLIDDSYDINQNFIFSDKEKNRAKNEYDLISFRDDVIYYVCMDIKNNKNEDSNEDKKLLTLIMYAYLRIIKNQFSKNFFIFIFSLCLFKGNFDFKYFVELLLKGVNEKNKKFLCDIINEILKQKGIEDKKIDKINYSLKGIKSLKNMVIDLIDKENKKE